MVTRLVVDLEYMDLCQRAAETVGHSIVGLRQWLPLQLEPNG